MPSKDPTDVGARRGGPDAAQEFPAGTLIGIYRIDAVLGRGGMGVVYRATDTKLHRPVAIKFLAAGIADEQARRRFRQEAETASSLNHPHIVTVHDVGEHDGQQYIVSELVDGGTLTDWAMRPHTWRQCVELLTGVADAVAGAHAAQVLHRDIKPGNILIGANGYAKLADFGLAKLAPGESSGVGPSPATGVGVVIGTVAYMSPEQASGQPLDARSDIFSFGAVLYELLAGQRPFEGATDLEVLKTIAHTAPAPLPRTVPDELRTVIDKALEKDPAERYQHMQDFVVDLRRVVRKSSSSSQLAASPEAPPKARRWGWIGAAGLALLGLALAVPATRYFMRAPEPAQQLRFDIAAPGYVGGRSGDLMISPGGERIAYTSVAGGKRQIWVRSLASAEAHPIAGTDGATQLFWAPDGQRLGFIADGKLKKVDIRGGPTQALADPSHDSGRNAWSGEGTIVYSMPKGSSLGVIGRVAESGGTSTPVTAIDASSNEIGHGMLSFLEDGRHFVFEKWRLVGPGTAGSVMVAVGSLAGEPPIDLMQIPWDDTGGAALYAGGYLFLSRAKDVAAQKLDPRSLRLSDDALPIASNVAEFSASHTGIFVYVEAATAGDAQPTMSGSFTWFDRHGEIVGRVDAPPGANSPRLSPDQRRIAFNNGLTATNPDIYTIDLERGATTRRTFDAGTDVNAIWSPDGSRLIFSSGRGVNLGANQIYARAANGSGGDELLYAGEPGELLVPSASSGDGRYLFFMRARRNSFTSRSDIWVLALTGDKKPFPLIESPVVKEGAFPSPNGRWIAYATKESGTRQIVVQPFPDPSGGRWDISTNGGMQPCWRSDGKELFYLGLDGTMMAVEVQGGGSDAFEFGPPRALFQTGIVVPEVPLEYFYDVAADGERFLVNVSTAGRREPASPAEKTTPIHVIVNWNAPPPR